tara:strand:+ start:142 stop:270 length:129 start_codon:yes stop_codon:yes gene_type:complete
MSFNMVFERSFLKLKRLFKISTVYLFAYLSHVMECKEKECGL